MDKKHKGAASELQASAWLLEQGYDVFRNLSAHGLADLIAVNYQTGETLKIDVKTVSTRWHTNGSVYKLSGKLSPEQIEVGVVALLVDGPNCALMYPQVES